MTAPPRFGGRGGVLLRRLLNVRTVATLRAARYDRGVERVHMGRLMEQSSHRGPTVMLDCAKPGLHFLVSTRGRAMARAILVSALLISVFGCANSSIPSDNASSENPGIEGDEQPGLPVAAFQDEQSGKYGYCDRRGRTVNEPQFDRADDFRDGMARVWLGHTISFIDPQGRTMFK